MDHYENAAADVRNRINQLLKEKGLTQNAVAAGNTPAQKRLNSQLSHGANISLDSVLRVLAACPDVSADWLLRGYGDMYRGTTITGANNVTGQRATVIGQQVGVTEDFVRGLSEDFVNKLLAEKDKQIEALLKLLDKK